MYEDSPDSPDTPKISTFKELLCEIMWSWEYPNYDFIKHCDGSYSLNKLSINPEFVSYKTSRWILEDGVFIQFEEFVKFLESTEKNDSA